jgi:uncharacterized RDD family membrane protein YckC
MAWYYASGAGQTGPLSEPDFARLAREGTISPGTLVWTDGQADWQPLSSVRPDLIGSAPLVAGVAVGAANKDLAVQQLREGFSGAQIGSVQYGGFWIRFVAAFIDGIILLVPQLILGFVLGMLLGSSGGSESAAAAGGLAQLLGIVIGWLYYAKLESSEKQATFGKRAVSLKVCDENGQRITFARATGRHFAKIISGMILAIGYIMAGFDDQKRALHDRMASTRVIVSR